MKKDDPLKKMLDSYDTNRNSVIAVCGGNEYTWYRKTKRLEDFTIDMIMSLSQFLGITETEVLTELFYYYNYKDEFARNSNVS